MKFSKVNAVRIPGGAAKKIRHNGKVLWSPPAARYVSLGDSIAAGHMITDDWVQLYGGENSQYGKNGNTETLIIPNTYTDLIRDELMTRVGGNVNVTSFAKSGDRVDDLMAKLDHDVVRNAIAKADYVTVCIGANDVLEPALSHLEQYINAGDSALAEIASIVEGNLANLANDSYAYSYRSLFDKLNAINPSAIIVFTTIYNPYKYLWLEEGENGFFAPVLNSIPQMSILGFEVDKLIKDSLLGASVVRTLFSRVNGLCDWAEKYVTRLNDVLREKIASFGNANFLVADTKAVFDSVPDRQITAPKHYNDLVNVEYTRGYNTATMDWGRLYEDSGDAGTFWWNLATKYTSWSGIDIGGLATELVTLMVEKVIVPDIDPHPETYGHHALAQSFKDTLGWITLPRRTISFNAGSYGVGSMAEQNVIVLDGMVPYVSIKANAFASNTEGYYFAGWKDANGTLYTNGQVAGLGGDLVLAAQWSNVYAVNVRHSFDSVFHGSGDTGPMECYALWIEGVEQPDLGAFSGGSRMYNLPYGTNVGVIAQVDSGSDRSYITWNDVKIAGNSDDARHGFRVTSHMDIHFQWNYWLDGLNPQSYWNCYITTY